MLDNPYIQSSTPMEYLNFYKHENKSRRIMIIDDDIDFRLLLSEILVGQGYSICTAKSGPAAIRNLTMMDELPQLIILDSHMPEGDGKEFLKHQKALKTFSHIPVVLISGDLMAKDEFKKENIAACLEKPLDMLEFIDLIQKKISPA